MNPSSKTCEESETFFGVLKWGPFRKKLMDTVEEGKDGMNRESSIEIYTLPSVKLDSQWKFTV